MFLRFSAKLLSYILSAFTSLLASFFDSFITLPAFLTGFFTFGGLLFGVKNIFGFGRTAFGLTTLAGLDSLGHCQIIVLFIIIFFVLGLAGFNFFNQFFV
jgi:hypothetical protein